jgi:hypothetical protein
MTWPTQTDYNNALQNPARVFAVPELQQGTVELNRLGVPRARSGAFANVYKLTRGTRQIAVKLFLYPNPQRLERYQTVSEHLRQVRLSCLVPFTYHDRGIRIGGEWYPVQAMDWVKGESLGEWVRVQLATFNLAALATMADHWSALVRELKSARIAHGDLQHDNILVVNDRPVLVDYDCMCVPHLVGEEATEWGKPAYQHPRRREQPLSLELDDFSAWVILIALKSIVHDPSLWQRYVAQTGNENLLFCEDDHRHPDRSPLWEDLLRHLDPDVAAWGRQLRTTLPDGAFDTIPPFGLDFWNDSDLGSPGVGGAYDPSPPSGRNLLGGLQTLCAAHPPDWEAISRAGADPRLNGQNLPRALADRITEARRRVEARDRLGAAVAAGDMRQIISAYDPSLLDDWASCAALVQQAQAARQKVALLDPLREEVKQTRDGRKLIALWGKLGPRLSGVAEAEPIRQSVLAWLARLDACDRYLEAIRVGRDERSIAAAWTLLCKFGGHPDAEPQRTRGEQAEKRSTCLDRLRKIATDETEDNDRRLVQEWDEVLVQGCREADPFRSRIVAARQRLRTLGDFQQLAKSADQGQVDEEQVISAAASSLTVYSSAVRARLQIARDRLALLAELTRLLAIASPADIAVAIVWDRLRAAGPPPRDRAIVDRCRLASQRRDALRKLQSISTTAPADEQDHLWTSDWNTALLAGCPDADPLRARHELATTRLRLWQELEDALAREDLEEVPRLAALPALHGYPPLQRRMHEVSELIWLAGQLQQIRTAARATPHDWDVLTRLCSDARLDKHRLPDDVAPVVAEARRRLDARRRLEQAAQGKSLLAWTTAHEPALVDDWPSCASLVRRARRARENLATLRQLENQARQTDDGSELLAAWDRHVADLADVPEADALRREVSLRRERLASARELETAVAMTPSSDLAIAAAWDRWQAAGGTLSPSRPRAELALKRRERLQRLHAIDEALPLDEQDRAWLAVWDESLLDDCADAEPLRSRDTLARERVTLWGRLDAALNGQDLDTVRQIAAHPLLEVYPPAQRRRREIGDLVWRWNHFQQMRELLRTVPRDWERIDRLARDGRLAGKAWPDDLTVGVAEARRRLAARDHLERAVRTTSLRQMVAAHAPPLVDDWAECAALVEQARRARELSPLLDELESALRSAGTGRLLVGLWTRHASRLMVYAEAEPIRQAAESWKVRIDACDAFLQALARGGERPIADAWVRLQQVGGHPEAAGHRAEGERAVARAECLDRLRLVAEGPFEDNDRAFTDAWQGALLQGCAEATPLRPRLEEGRRRLAILERLEHAIANCDHGGTEDAVAAIAEELTANYSPRLQPRIELARRRLDRLTELRDALAADPVSDEAVADAWETVSDLGAAPAEEPMVVRCLLAVRRRDRLRRLREIVTTLPPEGQDEGLLAEWDQTLLADCSDADPMRRRHELARERSGAWHDLETALQRPTLEHLSELAAHPLLLDYPPFLRRKEEIDMLVRTALNLRRITERLTANDPRTFDAETDRAFVAGHPELFSDLRDRIACPFRAWAIEGIRLTGSETPSLLNDGTRTVSIHFAWKPSQKIKHCLIAVDRERFLAAPCESAGPLHITMEDYRHAGGGFLLLAPKGSTQLFITIWPVIDLQWMEMAGPPLHLGPIPLIRLPSPPLGEPRKARKSSS